MKKTKLQNSNIVVSQTRLCVHNVPKQMTDKELKAMCLKAIRGKKHHIIEVVQVFFDFFFKSTELKVMKRVKD